MPISSLLIRNPSEPKAVLAPARSPALPTPNILRKSRLLLFVMEVSPLVVAVLRQLFGQHCPGAEGRTCRKTDKAGGQRIRPFPLLLQIYRCITVERGRLVNLDLVGNGHFEENVRFGTADTGVTYRYRPDADFIETLHRAVGIGRRAFASQLEEAVTLGMGFMTVGAGKSAGIEMGTAFAMLVNPPAIGKFGTPQSIELRDFLEGQVVHYRREQVVRAGGAT